MSYRNETKFELSEADRRAFVLAREALHTAETELVKQIIQHQTTLSNCTDDNDKTYYSNELAKDQVKLADAVVSRERLWNLQYKNWPIQGRVHSGPSFFVSFNNNIVNINNNNNNNNNKTNNRFLIPILIGLFVISLILSNRRE